MTDCSHDGWYASDDSETREGLTDLLTDATPIDGVGGTDTRDTQRRDTTDGRAVAFATTRDRVAAIVDVLTTHDVPPTTLVTDSDAIHVLARRVGRFEVATRASDLVASGRLTVRRTDLPPNPPAVVGDERAGLIGRLRDEVLVLDRATTDRLRDAATRVVRTAERYDPPLPGIDAITETLASTFDERVAADFTDSLDTACRASDEVDGLRLLLLVGGLHRLRWRTILETAADLGLATEKPLRTRKEDLFDRGWLTERPDVARNETGRPPMVLSLPDQLDVTPGGGIPDLILARAGMAE